MTILESMNCALPVLVRDLPIYDPILFDHALRGRRVEEFVTTLKQLQEEPDFYQRSAMPLMKAICGTARRRWEPCGNSFMSVFFRNRKKRSV